MSAGASLFSGKLVRLCITDLEADPALMVQWNQNSEYQHLLDSDASRLPSTRQTKEWLEKEFGNLNFFTIRTVAEAKTIGMIDLSAINWTSGDAWLGVGIGDTDYWGKGYGTEAVNLILRFGFEQLNLRRVSLTVFEYNERAYKSYLKLGFIEEGRARQMLNRYDRRWDMIYMGILRHEWEARAALALPAPADGIGQEQVGMPTKGEMEP